MADNQRGNVGSVLLESLGQAAAQFGQSLAQRKQMGRQAILQALQLYSNLQQQQQQMTLDEVRTEYYQYRTAQANAEARKAFLDLVSWTPWAEREKVKTDLSVEAKKQLLESSINTAQSFLSGSPPSELQSVTVGPGTVTLRRPTYRPPGSHIPGALTQQQQIKQAKETVLAKANDALFSLDEDTRKWLDPENRGISDERDFAEIAYKLAQGKEGGWFSKGHKKSDKLLDLWNQYLSVLQSSSGMAAPTPSAEPEMVELRTKDGRVIRVTREEYEAELARRGLK